MASGLIRAAIVELRVANKTPTAIRIGIEKKMITMMMMRKTVGGGGRDLRSLKLTGSSFFLRKGLAVLSEKRRRKRTKNKFFNSPKKK